jgi:hypothetical protein
VCLSYHELGIKIVLQFLQVLMSPAMYVRYRVYSGISPHWRLANPMVVFCFDNLARCW